MTNLREMNCRRIAFAIDRGIDNRVNHLYFGQFLAERYWEPGLFLEPLTRDYAQEDVTVGWLLKHRPDAIITTIEYDWKLFKKWIEATAEHGLQRPLLICMESQEDEPDQAGIIQNYAAEARAAVDLVTSRVERARFGVPKERLTIYVEGRWKGPSTPPLP